MDYKLYRANETRRTELKRIIVETAAAGKSDEGGLVMTLDDLRAFCRTMSNLD